MAFVLPTFNLQVNIWHGVVPIPPITSPALSPFVNLCVGRRGLLKAGLAPTSPAFMQLLAPWATDIRSNIYGGVADTIEAPAGSSRYYTVEFVDNVATAFPNQHVLAILKQTGTWPAPGPPAGGWYDTFTDTTGTLIPPHVPDSPPAGSYTAYNGSLKVSGNTCVAGSFATDPAGFLTAWASFNNGVRASSMALNFSLLNPTGVDFALLATRMDSSSISSGNFFEIRAAGNSLKIWKITSGAPGAPVSATLALSPLTVYTLIVNDNGSLITAIVGAVNVTMTDSTGNTRTRCAVGIGNTTPTPDVTFVDNLTVS